MGRMNIYGKVFGTGAPLPKKPLQPKKRTKLPSSSELKAITASLAKLGVLKFAEPPKPKGSIHTVIKSNEPPTIPIHTVSGNVVNFKVGTKPGKPGQSKKNLPIVKSSHILSWKPPNHTRIEIARAPNGEIFIVNSTSLRIPNAQEAGLIKKNLSEFKKQHRLY